MGLHCDRLELSGFSQAPNVSLHRLCFFEEIICCVIEVAGAAEVNDYLKLGWVLINQYVIDVG